MKRLTLLAALDASTGYGQTALAFVRGIEALTGARVVIRAVSVTERLGAKLPDDIKARIVRGPQSGDWELLLHHPMFVPTPGKKTAYYSMNESTKLNPMSVHLLNQAVVVIVPSEFCAVTFSASGVTAPIRVVPLGFDPSVYHWRPMPNGGDLVFGAAGGLAGGRARKGLGDVVSAFQKAFPREKFKVRLKIKCHPEQESDEWTEDDRIEVTTAHLSDAQLAEWYSSLHAFVSVSKGEGFGLMSLQAMACGRPVLSPKFGGVAEFLSGASRCAIPHTLVPAPPPYHGHWCQVKESDLIAHLQLFHFFQKTLGDGRAEAVTAAEFTWLRSCERLVAVLEEFGALAEIEPEFHAL